jgi:hypothetical protein
VFLVCFASQTSENIKILPREDQDRIRRRHESRNTNGHAWPIRPKDDDPVADNIGIYPRLNRGLIFNGVTVFRLRARLTISAIEFYESR